MEPSFMRNLTGGQQLPDRRRSFRAGAAYGSVRAAILQLDSLQTGASARHGKPLIRRVEPKIVALSGSGGG
jgi:hypothetical protein